MRLPPLRKLIASVALASAITLGPTARAEVPSAPALAGEALRRQANDELRALLDASPETRDKLTGVYVAFDPSVTNPIALAACDDDGDYAVVLSDALLRLLDLVALARAHDETRGTHKVDEYAGFLAHAQSADPRARVLPPPPGFFETVEALTSAKVKELQSRRFVEALDGVIAHELAHMTGGNLVCPHPTPTRERGDDVWTDAESRAAGALTPKIYTSARVLVADSVATELLLSAGARRTRGTGTEEEGYVAWLTLGGALASSSYARVHQPVLTGVAVDPSAATALRVQVVRAAATRWRLSHAERGRGRER